MTEEDAITICKNIIRSINGDTCYMNYSKEQDKEAIETLLDLYKKEKNKNSIIKNEILYREQNFKRKDGTTKYEKLNKKNKFGHNGVCEDKRHKRKKYRAYINLRYKQISLGTYDNLEDAIKAREDGEKAIKKLLEE